MAAPFNVVFALYPRITQLDFTGPYEVLTRLPGARCVLASVAGGELEVDSVLRFSGPSTPRQRRRMRPALRARRLRHRGRGRGPGLSRRDSPARRTGPLHHLGMHGLAAAGGGRTAAWQTRRLPLGVARQARRLRRHAGPGRVVRDGNIFTGGGVTAGIDMALEVMAEIGGRDFAETVQLAIEYAPAPPFDSGRPELAREPVLRAARARMDSVRVERDAAIRRAAAALACTPELRRPSSARLRRATFDQSTRRVAIMRIASTPNSSSEPMSSE